MHHCHTQKLFMKAISCSVKEQAVFYIKLLRADSIWVKIH